MRLGSTFRWLGLILTLALVGCGGAPTPTRTFTPTRVSVPTPAVFTAVPTPLPLATLPPVPTTTLTPTLGTKATPTRVATVPAGSMRIKIFMIALNNAGKLGKKIGCNDSVVAVERIIPSANAVLRASLNELLSLDFAPASQHKPNWQGKSRGI